METGVGAEACHAITQPSQAAQHRQHARDIYTGLGVPEATRLPTTPGPRQGQATSHTDAPARSR